MQKKMYYHLMQSYPRKVEHFGLTFREMQREVVEGKIAQSFSVYDLSHRAEVCACE